MHEITTCNYFSRTKTACLHVTASFPTVSRTIPLVLHVTVLGVL